MDASNKTIAAKISKKSSIKESLILYLLNQIQKQTPEFKNIQFLGKQEKSLILTAFNQKSEEQVALRIVRLYAKKWLRIYQEDKIIHTIELENDIPNLVKCSQDIQQPDQEGIYYLILYEIKITKNLIQQFKKIHTLKEIAQWPEKIQFLVDRSSKAEHNQIKAIKGQLKYCINLQYVSLSFSNSLFENGTGELLGEGLSNCKRLFHLELYFASTNISESCTYKIIEHLSVCTLLRHLAISYSHNKLGNKSGILLGQSLSKLQSLHNLELYLNTNLLKDEAAEQIGKGISQIPHLQLLILELQGNEIKDEGLLGLTKQLSFSKSLSCLKLQMGGLGLSKGGQEMIDYISNCRNLCFFQLEFQLFKLQEGYNKRFLKLKRLVNYKLQQ